MKIILLMFLLASCAHVHETFPSKNANESRWTKEYSDGKISWEEYQSRLKSEEQP